MSIRLNFTMLLRIKKKFNFVLENYRKVENFHSKENVMFNNLFKSHLRHTKGIKIKVFLKIE